MMQVSAYRRAAWKLLSIFQRSPFTSSKLVGEQNTLLGYGVNKDIENVYVSTQNLAYFVGIVTFGVLLRHKNMTYPKARKIIQYVEQRVGVEYAVNHLFKSLLSRMVGETVQFLKNPFKTETTDTEEIALQKKAVRDSLEPLICSSLLAIAYRLNNVPITTSLQNDKNIWPKDILLSEDMEVVGLLQTRSAK